MCQFVVALVNRKQTAHAEQQDGDNEAPEITEFAVTKRMFFIRRSLRLLQSQVEQHLVSCIRVGMYRLGQHAAGPRQPGGPGLGDGDTEVGDESVENCTNCRVV